MDLIPGEQHPHSVLIDPHDVAKEIGTKLPLRVSKHNDVALRAEAQISKEWYSIGGDCLWGGACPKANAICITMPDISPARLPPMVRITDMLFFIDDVIEKVPIDEVDAAAFDFYRASNPDVSKTNFLSTTGKKPNQKVFDDAQRQILAKVLLEFFPLGRQHAELVVDIVDRFSHVQSRPRVVNETWDDYVLYRVNDGALRVYCAFLVYANDLNLSREDIEEVEEITFPACGAVIITNDYYSYDKEVHQRKSASELDNNAITYVMNTRNIASVVEAKRIVIEELIPGLEQRFLDKFQTYLQSNDPRKSDHMTRYLQAVGYMTSGNWYWSKYCDRYNNYQVPRAHPPKCCPDEFYPFTVANGHIKDSSDPQLSELITLSRVSEYSILHDDRLAREPSEYIRSLPSKGLRGQALRAMNVWLRLTEPTLERIERVINHLHECSLLLDDIEDNSPLRRGKPTTHLIYGQSQTINAANYLYVLALKEVLQFENPLSQKIYADELGQLHIGQSYDLHWSQNNVCPKMRDYMEMVANKTGGLFRMLGLLMLAESKQSQSISEATMRDFMTLLGQYYQIRDDYLNLASTEYEAKKGFAEDLDEGKYSLPLIHALETSSQRLRLENMLQQRHLRGGMTPEMKQIVLDIMSEVGSLEFTKNLLAMLEVEINDKIVEIEGATGEVNYVLRLLFERMKVK